MLRWICMMFDETRWNSYRFTSILGINVNTHLLISTAVPNSSLTRHDGP